MTRLNRSRSTRLMSAVLPSRFGHLGVIACLSLAGVWTSAALAQATQPTTTPVVVPPYLAVRNPLPTTTDDPMRPAGLTQSPTRASSWSDAKGQAYQRSGVGTWSNYDEARANPYPLPDPLVMKNGQTVTDAQTWWTVRRPEILGDLQTEMYGRIPDNTPKITWKVTATDTTAAKGTAIMKSVVGQIDNSQYPRANPSIHITMYTPSNAAGPVPLVVVVIAGPGGYGGQNANGPEPAPQPNPPATSPLYQFLAAGWGYATLEVGPIQNDSSAGLSTGIIGLMSAGQPRKGDDLGVLSAWSWGLSRSIDYFETDNTVDAKQLGVEGHSRYGKAALLAEALDQRWAIGFASCSGEGGAKPSKRNWGETLDDISGSYWMDGNFRKYAGHWNELTVDSPELISMVAPRPVFITGGTGDQWSDPHGEFLATVAAGPVYRLLGKKDLGTSQMPAPDEELISGDLAFRYHNGPHTDTLDWPTFIKFAQHYLKAPAAQPK